MKKALLSIAILCGLGVATLEPAPAKASMFLNLLQMPDEITICSGCNTTKSGFDCIAPKKNCILGGFWYTPPGGQPTYYDGKWYPGVR